MKKIKRCLLIILDGFGINHNKKEKNAVLLSKTPHLDSLFKKYPSTEIICHGKDVGLPKGIMGNSEVGHLNIGAGRIVYQDLLRINESIEDSSFFKNKSITNFLTNIKKNDLHILGLLSDGGVHSHINHLFAILKIVKQKNIKNVFIHPILDGRDTSPTSGINYIKKLQDFINKNKIGKIASLCGRFYAMDRDNRWNRTEKAYNLFTFGKGIYKTNSITAIEEAYEKGETDEFIKPIVIVDENKNTNYIKNGDGVLFFNFRADRARQITKAFINSKFYYFDRKKIKTNFISMTKYSKDFDIPVFFPPVFIQNTIGEIISKKFLNQLRIAETEKYAHITYFFNGGIEKPFEKEDRVLVPSPKNIATYDMQPEMSAFELTKIFLKKIKEKDYSFIVLNFANPDMVGHTGDLKATKKAIEAVDLCLGKIIKKFKKEENAIIITSDHGNAEQMTDKKGQKHTAHTLNKTPFLIISEVHKNSKLKKGTLKDIAPTILKILEIEKNNDMTGNCLL